MTRGKKVIEILKNNNMKEYYKKLENTDNFINSEKVMKKRGKLVQANKQERTETPRLFKSPWPTLIYPYFVLKFPQLKIKLLF